MRENIREMLWLNIQSLIKLQKITVDASVASLIQKFLHINPGESTLLAIIFVENQKKVSKYVY